MQTARSLGVSRSIQWGGVCIQGGLHRRGVCQLLTPIMQTPLEADFPWMQTSPGMQTPPGCRSPSPGGRSPRMQTPLLDADPLCEQTDRCKNITLPQTSFAGCKNSVIDISVQKNLIVMKTAYNVQFLVHISLFLTGPSV